MTKEINNQKPNAVGEQVLIMTAARIRRFGCRLGPCKFNEHLIRRNSEGLVSLYKLYTVKLPTSKKKFPRRHQQRNVEVPSVPLSLRKKQVKSTQDLETKNQITLRGMFSPTQRRTIETV